MASGGADQSRGHAYERIPDREKERTDDVEDLLTEDRRIDPIDKDSLLYRCLHYLTGIE